MTKSKSNTDSDPVVRGQISSLRSDIRRLITERDDYKRLYDEMVKRIEAEVQVCHRTVKHLDEDSGRGK